MAMESVTRQRTAGLAQSLESRDGSLDAGGSTGHNSLTLIRLQTQAAAGLTRFQEYDKIRLQHEDGVDCAGEAEQIRELLHIMTAAEAERCAVGAVEAQGSLLAQMKSGPQIEYKADGARHSSFRQRTNRITIVDMAEGIEHVSLWEMDNVRMPQ